MTHPEIEKTSTDELMRIFLQVKDELWERGWDNFYCKTCEFFHEPDACVNS